MINKGRLIEPTPRLVNMAKTVADLNLDDEHITIGIEDTIQEGARRMLSVSGGIVIVLSNDNKVRGVLGHNQFLKAMAESADATTSTCAEWMEMDFLEVQLSDTLKSVLNDVQKRAPQAVVAVDANGEFAGYFSPNDYQEASELVSSLKSLNL